MKTLHSLALSAVLIATSAMQTACGSNGIKGVAETPKLSVRNLQMQDVGLAGATALLDLKVNNPNAFPLPIKGLDYALQLNGHTIANGYQASASSIKAKSSQTVQIPIKIDFISIASMLPKLIKSGEVQYKLNGSVHMPYFKLPFDKQGVTQFKQGS